MSLDTYIIRGGIWGWDGPVSSYGMDVLASRIIRQIPGVTANVHNWSDSSTVIREIDRLSPEARVALVGYSGGGWKAAEICNEVGARTIDLLIAIDPSPYWWMERTPIQGNVLKAICYHNENPLMGNLGGGILRSNGVPVITYKVREQHLTVQFDEAIRAGVMAALRMAAQ